MSEHSASAAGAASNGSGSTYEATRARQMTIHHADKIHWERSYAYREEAYRLLHHQKGYIGRFRIRLLEAADLKRSYWSALALGPVKHLGLSKAHGPVSAFCTFSLQFNHVNSNISINHDNRLEGNKKPAASGSKATSQQSAGSAASVVTPVIPSNNNPVWENCQFDFPLLKGAMPDDGMRVLLTVRVDEDATAVETLLPGIPTGGDSRLIGVGVHDVTELCFGECSRTGQPIPGVRDIWIPISLQQQDCEEEDGDDFEYAKGIDPLAPPTKSKKDKDSTANRPSITGMVRVLVSYQPIGLEPQPKDIIALEAFARRNPTLSSCRPILDGLKPLVVIERRGSYILAETTLAECHSSNGNTHGQRRRTCVRLHRNTVFVIERQDIVDAARNLALLPLDVVLSTPVGQGVAEMTAPLVHAGKELLMPALLSFKLLWMAGRTTTLAGWSGVQAVWTTFWHEGSNSLTGGGGNHHNNSNHNLNHRGSNRGGLRRSGSSLRDSSRRDGHLATAQFIQL